jgi:two-component system, OmpR family, KDP operon response regulator KdpE
MNDVTSGRVLCVDDDPQILRALTANLRARGYTVDAATTGESALRTAVNAPPDAVILDLGLPGMSGLEVIAGLRGWTAVPILVLSARDGETDKIAALDAGADDYVAKPFGMGELLARLRAAIRRSSAASDVSGETAVVVTSHFTIDLAKKRVTREAGEVRLTPTEWGIVEALVRSRGRLITGRQLLQTVWGPAYGDETNYLRVHLAHIRRKLEPIPGEPRYFITEVGVGYRFEYAEVTDPSR